MGVSKPTRRDFLKLGSALSGALAASRLLPQAAAQPAAAASLPNIIILVFDAMSAKHLSLYGYPRNTTPNFERFAARATVYDQHYSAGNFTSPGTASLLTGLYPWTHRAINLAGLIAAPHVEHNLFRLLGAQYHRLAYSQNIWPNYFFGQFKDSLEEVLSPAAFSVLDQVIGARFPGDLLNSHRAFAELLFQDGEPPAALVLGLAENIALYRTALRVEKPASETDIAHTFNYPITFRLEDVFRGMLQTLAGRKPPFLAYLHTWSPHDPYEPSADFTGLFHDGWHPVDKPVSALSRHIDARESTKQRTRYDRYIANVDFEFGHLLDSLQANGLLDSSYIIVTSDHGELIERGEMQHNTPLLYDPVVRVPLIISAPGQTTRRDIRVPSSGVDILPTLAHLSGQPAPDWCEGQVLPGLGGTEDRQRSIFMCEAKDNHPWTSWSHASYALRKDRHKLTYYTGYQQLGGHDAFELYDIANDPEELNNLYSPSSSAAQDLRAELMKRVEAENAKYPTTG